jgi:hypothetical protein
VLVTAQMGGVKIQNAGWNGYRHVALEYSINGEDVTSAINRIARKGWLKIERYHGQVVSFIFPYHD